jgi:hypothetical protein
MPMRVDIQTGMDPGTLDVRIADAGPDVPAAIRVTPDGEGRPFVTRPPGHRFEGYIGDFGPPRDLLRVARDYLAKRIDRAAAEREFATVLQRWTRMSHARPSAR